MKRVILTDSKSKATRLFVNPPWRLGSFKPKKDDNTFDVRMIHEDGQVLTINVNAELISLKNRFKDW